MDKNNFLHAIPEDKVYFSIGEVASIFQVNTSLIRYWEKEFPQIKPRKNKKGDRSFTKSDIYLIHDIYTLVKEKGFTLEGAKKAIHETHGHEKKKLLHSLIKLRERLEYIKSSLELMKKE